MLRAFAALIALVGFLAPQGAAAETDEPLKVLMTVGGVDYHTRIVRRLRAKPNIELQVVDFDDVEAVFTDDALSGVDAVLMYHRDNTADDSERLALKSFLKRGGGVVVLHHSIANYQDWNEWHQEYVGGLYVLRGHKRLPPSRYFPDFEGVASVAAPHPALRRFDRAWLYADESYERLWIADDVTPLLQTAAFGSDELLAWVGPSKNGRVIYIQPGHGERIMRRPIYLNLLEDALRWTAGRE